MKKLILTFLLGMSMIWAAPSVWASYTWDVQPGPDGTMRVTTSNGVFIVDIEGSQGWVGTEDEYEQRRIAGVLKSHGMHEIKIKGQSPNVHEIAMDWMPSVTVGTTDIVNIYTEIYFDAKADNKLHRPRKPANSEYVGVVWTQSDGVQTQAKIVDEEIHQSYSPHYCHDIPGNLRTCEFIIPWESLPHQSALLFARANSQPVVVPRLSLTQEHDEIILEKYKPDRAQRQALDDEDAATLRSLHALDSSIATSLPPVPPGVVEIKPIPKECRQDQPAISQAEFDAVTIGESLDEVQCHLGVAKHFSPVGVNPDYYWRMKGKVVAYAVIKFTGTVAPAVPVVMSKHLSDISGWAGF